MEGPNSLSVCQHLVSSSFNVHTTSSTIVPITEAFQTLSKIDTNGDASVASDKIYDEIDELKFEIKTRAATEVVIANTRPTKPTRSSFLSKFLSFHRNSPRSISLPNQCQTLKSPPQEDPIPSTSPRAMDISMCDDGIADSNSQFNSRPAASDLTGQIRARPYDWPHDGSLNKFTTALVIVDMQKDCKPYIIISLIICGLYGTGPVSRSFFRDAWLSVVISMENPKDSLFLQNVSPGPGNKPVHHSCLSTLMYESFF